MFLCEKYEKYLMKAKSATQPEKLFLKFFLPFY